MAWTIRYVGNEFGDTFGQALASGTFFIIGVLIYILEVIGIKKATAKLAIRSILSSMWVILTVISMYIHIFFYFQFYS